MFDCCLLRSGKHARPKLLGSGYHAKPKVLGSGTHVWCQTQARSRNYAWLLDPTMIGVLVFSRIFFNRKVVGSCFTHPNEWAAPVLSRRCMRYFPVVKSGYPPYNQMVDVLSFTWCDVCRHIMVGLSLTIDCLCFFSLFLDN